MKIIDIIKKKPKLFAIGFAIIATAVAGTSYGYTAYIDNQPAKKVDILKDIDVSFEGTDGIGKATYNEDELKGEIVSEMVRANHLPYKSVYLRYENKKYHTEISSDLSDKQSEKASDIANWFKKTKISIPNKELENGEKIKVSITSPQNSHNPIKNSSKEFKVSGLGKTKNIDVDKYIEAINVTFVGVSGVGKVVLDTENPYVLEQLKMYKHPALKTNGKLKNGDKITIDYTDNLFQNTKDHKYVGDRKVTLTVSGLLEPDKISNWDEVTKKLDDEATRKNDSPLIPRDRFESKVTKKSDFFLSPALYYTETKPQSDKDFDEIEFYDSQDAYIKVMKSGFVIVNRNYEYQIEGGEDLNPHTSVIRLAQWVNGDRLESFDVDIHTWELDRKPNEVVVNKGDEKHFSTSRLDKFANDYGNEFSTTMKKYIRIK